MIFAVLDLFSAAAGGWSLGMHRAGFRTVAACEWIDWRRALYAQNNPGVPIYDDVRTLTADRLLADLGYLPQVIVGSPPCQDISSANTKGKGVEGERSGLFFEAVRLIGEVRPRWFALENSSNLRTRGADAVLAALEALDYACWPCVVRASDIGANHERPRSWLIGCDVGQVGDADLQPGTAGFDPSAREGGDELGSGRLRPDADCGRARSLHAPDAHRDPLWQSILSERSKPEAAIAGDDAGDPAQDGRGPGLSGRRSEPASRSQFEARGDGARNTPDPDQAGQADGCLVAGLRQAEIADDGCRDRRGDDQPGIGQMAICAPDSGDPAIGGPLWSLDDLAHRLWLDARLPARVAGTRVAVGGPRGTSAASLIVEAYGDSVVPQIPEAIGRAILRVERAMRAIA